MSKTSILNQINTITDKGTFHSNRRSTAFFWSNSTNVVEFGLEKSKIFLETTKWKFLKGEILYNMVI